MSEQIGMQRIDFLDFDCVVSERLFGCIALSAIEVVNRELICYVFDSKNGNLNIYTVF